MLEDEQRDFFKAARQHIGRHLLAPIPEKQVWLHLALRAVLLFTLPVIAMGFALSFQTISVVYWVILFLGFVAGTLYMLWMRRDKVVARCFELRSTRGERVAAFSAEEDGVHWVITGERQAQLAVWSQTDGTLHVSLARPNAEGELQLGLHEKGAFLSIDTKDRTRSLVLCSIGKTVSAAFLKDGHPTAHIRLDENGNIRTSLPEE